MREYEVSCISARSALGNCVSRSQYVCGAEYRYKIPDSPSRCRDDNTQPTTAVQEPDIMPTSGHDMYAIYGLQLDISYCYIMQDDYDDAATSAHERAATSEH